MKVKFNSSEIFTSIHRCQIAPNFVKLVAEDLVWDLSGFVMYEDDEETIIRDCSDYNYQWNIYTDIPNGVVLTNSETEKEKEPDPNAPKPMELLDPLTNEELTECVADLMTEVDMIKMGI